MKRLRTLSILPAVVVLLATGCGGSDSESSGSLPAVSDTAPASVPSEPTSTDAPADELAGDTVVFVWTESGGCAMAGPNCARYEITVDGTVETFRDMADAADGPAATGSIDPALVATWLDAVNDEDLDALRARVGEGEMTAAFDGVDYAVANPVTGAELSSVETAFDESEAVFSSAFAVAEAARAAAPLEMEMR